MFFFTLGLELPFVKDMEKETWHVVFQSCREREPNCPHGCNMGKESSHRYK